MATRDQLGGDKAAQPKVVRERIRSSRARISPVFSTPNRQAIYRSDARISIEEMGAHREKGPVSHPFVT